MRRGNHTKRVPIALFSQGSDAKPVSAGKVFMMYRRVRKPGASIVSHAILPGMLNLLFEDVLPAPYQEMAHCRFASCCLSVFIRGGEANFLPLERIGTGRQSIPNSPSMEA